MQRFAHPIPASPGISPERIAPLWRVMATFLAADRPAPLGASGDRPRRTKQRQTDEPLSLSLVRLAHTNTRRQEQVAEPGARASTHARGPTPRPGCGPSAGASAQPGRRRDLTQDALRALRHGRVATGDEVHVLRGQHGPAQVRCARRHRRLRGAGEKRSGGGERVRSERDEEQPRARPENRGGIPPLSPATHSRTYQVHHEGRREFGKGRDRNVGDIRLPGLPHQLHQRRAEGNLRANGRRLHHGPRLRAGDVGSGDRSRVANDPSCHMRRPYSRRQRCCRRRRDACADRKCPARCCECI